MKCELCGFEQPCPVCKDDNGTLAPVSETQKYELWIDVYHNDGPWDWKVLRANGVAGVCAKMGYGWDKFRGISGSWEDSKFRQYMTEAKNAGLKIAGYWWADPYESWGRQVDVCMDAARGIPLEWIASDMELEQGWKFVYNKKKQKSIWQLVDIENKEMAACNKYILDKTTAELNIPGVLYTRNQFLGADAVAMLDKYWLWIASKPYEKVITHLRWEALAKMITYCPTWDEWREKHMLKPDGDWKPLHPKRTEWKIWQFSFEKVKLPGAGSYMDLNWMRSV